MLKNKIKWMKDDAISHVIKSTNLTWQRLTDFQHNMHEIL